MWFVYILLCSGNRLYTGIAADVEKRFQQHKNGKGAKFTKSFKPVRVIYTEKYSSQSEALKREIQIKSWNRQRKIRDLNLNPVI